MVMRTLALMPPETFRSTISASFCSHLNSNNRIEKVRLRTPQDAREVCSHRTVSLTKAINSQSWNSDFGQLGKNVIGVWSDAVAFVLE